MLDSLLSHRPETPAPIEQRMLLGECILLCVERVLLFCLSFVYVYFRFARSRELEAGALWTVVGVVNCLVEIVVVVHNKVLHPNVSTFRAFGRCVVGIVYGVMHMIVMYSVHDNTDLKLRFFEYIFQAVVISSCVFMPIISFVGWRLKTYILSPHDNDYAHMFVNTTALTSLLSTVAFYLLFKVPFTRARILFVCPYTKAIADFPTTGIVGSLFGYFFSNIIIIARALVRAALLRAGKAKTTDKTARTGTLGKALETAEALRQASKRGTCCF